MNCWLVCTGPLNSVRLVKVMRFSLASEAALLKWWLVSNANCAREGWAMTRLRVGRLARTATVRVAVPALPVTVTSGTSKVTRYWVALSRMTASGFRP